MEGSEVVRPHTPLGRLVGFAQEVGRRLGIACVALIALRLVVLTLVIINVPAYSSPVVQRSHEITTTLGVPYRDFQVEYPIGELGLIELIGPLTSDTARLVLGLIAFTADIVVFVVLLWGWDLAAARRYLWLGTPLLIFIYRRSDLIAVAFAVLGIALAKRKRQGAGGTALGLAGLVKLWPCVLIPIFLIKKRVTATRTFAVVLLSGLAGWLILGGLRGIKQVITFRGASGWEFESTIGAVVWVWARRIRFEAGASRVGSIPGWAHIVSVVVLAAGLVAAWVLASRSRFDPAGVPALVAVAIVLAVSPVFSPGYAAWLLPWGAIGAAEGRAWWRLAFAPCLLTGLTVATWDFQLVSGHPGRLQTLLILRNLCVLAVPAFWFLGKRTSTPRTAQDPASSGESV